MDKPYTIKLKNLDGWWSAICPELCVSGFGNSKKEDVDSLVRSIRSTLEAQASSFKQNSKNIEQMADFESVA